MFSTIYASERPTGVAALDCKLDAEERFAALGVPTTRLRLPAFMSNLTGAPGRPHRICRLLLLPRRKRLGC